MDLLIQAGANVNIQDKSKRTALWLASARGNLEIVRRITAVSGAELETENIGNWSPLHIAAINGHTQIVECLVKAKVHINKQGQSKKTALHCATKHPGIVKLLINHGADPNLKDSDDQTSLYIATVGEDIESVKLMVEMGADPYLQKSETDTAFDAALDKKDMNLLSALWNKDSTKNLYQSIVDNDKEKTTHLLSENQFAEQELSVCFLSSVNHHRFDIASILLDHKNGLQSKYERIRTPEQDLKIDQQNGVTKETLHKGIYDFYKDYFRKKLICEGTSFEDKSESVLDAFAQMSELLYDIPACTELLKPIDYELKVLLPQLKDIQSKENVVIKELSWPAALPENYQPLDKKGALRRILRTHLQKQDIESQNELYNFAGFVETETANALVKTGALFKEQFLLGNALTHGLYSHFFQWVSMALAIETGRVKLKDGVSLKEILQASVEIKSKVGDGAWGLIIDNVSPLLYAKNGEPMRLGSENYNRFFSSSSSRYRLSSVVELSNFLYTSSELPHIRGYLLDSLYKNTHKIQRLMKEKFPEDEQIKPKHIIAGQATSFWAFNRFRIGLSNDDVSKYYEKCAKTQGKLDQKTGIVTKSITALHA